MGYCDGLYPHLDSKKHKCRQTGERLGYIKGWWGTTYEHHGFHDCDKKDLEYGKNNITSNAPRLL